MIAEGALISVGILLQDRQIGSLLVQFIQTSLRQVRVAADETLKLGELFSVHEGVAVSSIELGRLFIGEVLERQSRADIERRLIQVGYEQMSFGCVGDADG